MNRAFFQPGTVSEALECRRNHKGSTLLAGGTDLIASIYKNKEPEESIIDLSKIEELKEIQIQDDEIKIGAMVNFTGMEDSQTLNEKAKVLCRAARSVGSPQIRNRGTIGGNICNAGPAADLVPALVCLEAKVELQSMYAGGNIQKRLVALEDFITDKNQTLLEDSEILTNIIFKVPPDGVKSGFEKIGRRNALAVARINGACLLWMDNNIVSKINIVIGSVTSRPERYSTVEDYLKGKKLDYKVLKEAGILASNHVLKQTGGRSSSTYKLPVISRFTASLIENTIIKGG